VVWVIGRVYPPFAINIFTRDVFPTPEGPPITANLRMGSLLWCCDLENAILPNITKYRTQKIHKKPQNKNIGLF
jgi:hypothetical protein